MDFDDEDFGYVVGVRFVDKVDQLWRGVCEGLDRASPLLSFADFALPAIDAEEWAVDLNASGQASGYNLLGQDGCSFG